jgi:N-acetylglucosaminyldiphosphoundecaprenol N-acetyl-beta-D-mannosaminyltransferase
VGSVIDRVDVLGVGISAVDTDMVIDEIARWIAEGEQHYVCVTGVHGVMESQRDPDLLRIHNEAGLAVPDGMPMVWASHYAGAPHVKRVCGPDLMLEVLRRAEVEGWSSFFYGGKEGVPEALCDRLRERFPALKVVGTYSPPFRPLTSEEDEAVCKMISDARPDLVWVGLSTPKQEAWMAAHQRRISAHAVLGVGAAFDFHTGLTKRAPLWMQRSGLEWFYRLVTEPRRLWRRYLRNNPEFMARIVMNRPRLRAREGPR